MGLKEDIMDVKKEMDEVRQHSIAWEMIKDTKDNIRRVCIAFSVVLSIISILWGLTIAYLIHTLNDIGTEEISTETTSQEVSDIGSVDNSYIINGDNYGKDKTN